MKRNRELEAGIRPLHTRKFVKLATKNRGALTILGTQLR